jgi:hypothetical protein
LEQVCQRLRECGVGSWTSRIFTFLSLLTVTVLCQEDFQTIGGHPRADAIATCKILFSLRIPTSGLGQ